MKNLLTYSDYLKNGYIIEVNNNYFNDVKELSKYCKLQIDYYFTNATHEDIDLLKKKTKETSKLIKNLETVSNYVDIKNNLIYHLSVELEKYSNSIKKQKELEKIYEEYNKNKNLNSILLYQKLIDKDCSFFKPFIYIKLNSYV